MPGNDRFECKSVEKYDGLLIHVDGKVALELGNYLGSGAAGSVYQATDFGEEEKQVAVKILQPIGYKLLPAGQLARCICLRKGISLSPEQYKGKSHFLAQNVWWLQVPSNRQIIAAYEVCFLELLSYLLFS